MQFLAPARANVGAQTVSVSQAALDRSLDYAREREQFGQSLC